MENFKEKIEYYIEKNKKNSKLNKSETAEVVLALKTELVEGRITTDEAIGTLLNLHYSVTAEFIKNAFDKLDDQIKMEFVNKFLSTKKVVKNSNNFGITRCLVVINELLKTTENNELIHVILKVCAKRAYGKDGGQKAADLLAKICFKDTKSKLFLLDYSGWQETELRNLAFWIYNAIVKISDKQIIADYGTFVEKYNLPKSKKIHIDNSQNPRADINNTTETIAKTEEEDTRPEIEFETEIEILVSNLQRGIEKTLNNRFELLSQELEQIKTGLEQLNKNRQSVVSQLMETSNKNLLLQEQLNIKDKQLMAVEKKMAEMDERLQYAYNADRRAEYQELSALKNDLIKELRLDYDAFQKLASKEPDQYHIYYEGLVGVIENIFDSLRRKGIIIKNVNG